MASGDRHGQSRRKASERGPEKRQDQEEEQEQEVVEEQDQQRATQQDAFGNQGIAELLGLPTVKPGTAGLAIDPQRREEDAVLQYGGDDVPDDGPLTIDDLVRSWNPSTRRGQDQPVVFDEPLSGDLPDEDAALLAEVRSDRRRPDLPAHTGIDALVQPSVAAVTTDPGPWAREAARWATGSLVHRTWAHLVSPPAPCLQDAHGRLVHSRVRVAALASLLVLDGPLAPSTRAAVVPSFCLDLAGRVGAFDRVAALARGLENKLPVARDLLAAALGERRHTAVPGRPLPAAAAAHLAAVVRDLVQPPDPAVLVPSAVEPGPAEEADDPLGLDAVVTSLTGGPQDPLAGVYDGLLQAAERMAGLCARLRVDAAGLLLAVAESCDLWTAGAPVRDLLAVAEHVDAEAQKVLQLLVEIARAVQKRAVPPPGVRNGLRRAARALEQAFSDLPGLVGPVVGGVLPASADVPGVPTWPQDALAAAWADGEPAQALHALGALPASLDRDVAIAWTRAAAERPGAALADEIVALSARAEAQGRALLAGALALSAGPSLLWAGHLDKALAVGKAGVAAALVRRNGTWLAASALLEVEARLAGGDAEGARGALRDATWRCWHVGSPAGLTLLLRWRPPAPEPGSSHE